MTPDRFDFEPLANIATKQRYSLQLPEAPGFIAQRDGSQLALIASRRPRTAAIVTQYLATGATTVLRSHSRISSVKRRFSFIPAAPTIVRIDRAVRPCRPITFPRSLGATRNSSTVTCSPRPRSPKPLPGYRPEPSRYPHQVLHVRLPHRAFMLTSAAGSLLDRSASAGPCPTSARRLWSNDRFGRDSISPGRDR